MFSTPQTDDDIAVHDAASNEVTDLTARRTMKTVIYFILHRRRFFSSVTNTKKTQYSIYHYIFLFNN